MISFELDPEVRSAMLEALKTETNPIARDIITAILENADLAETHHLPLCQDTGTALVFAEIGNQLSIEGGLLSDAINKAISIAWKANYLRASIASDPLFSRKNTADNTPAVIHYDIVEGSNLKLMIAQKGGGAENMSILKMLPPSTKPGDIVELVSQTVIHAGGNPCPPLIVGIGIGGNFESCALLSKKALFLPLSYENPNPEYTLLERDILRAINNSGIGPQGLGGDTTAFAVHIQYAPCHIASLPVAINLQCHAHRHHTVII